MENYIVINGKKAELTKEQLKALGIEVEKKHEMSRNENGIYYTISLLNTVREKKDDGVNLNNHIYNRCNYFTDKNFAQQEAYHRELNGLMMRFALDNDDLIRNEDWSNHNLEKWAIYFYHGNSSLNVDSVLEIQTQGVIYFKTKTVAQKCIEEVIKPFMDKHPDFKW